MFNIKLGKRNHSLYVVFRKYTLGVLFAILAKYIFLPFVKKSDRILTLSHTYSGNASAFTEWLSKNTNHEIGFICDDPFLYKKLKKKNLTGKIRLLSLHSLRDLKYISGSKVICTTHDAVFLRYWKNSEKRPMFVGMWHGVGFKGGGDGYKESLDFYEAQFVSSPYFKKLHEKWGFNKNRLFVTGYARTDKLVGFRKNLDLQNKILKKYGVESKGKKIILFAPTWKINEEKESNFIGESISSIVNTLAKIGEENNCLILLRAHLNAKVEGVEKDYLKIVPSSDYPDTETLLMATDLLVTDWSSIFTDFLPLHRPVIFLDTKPDFKLKGLQPEDRVGSKVRNINQLKKAISANLINNGYSFKDKNHVNAVIKKAWGDTLDGRSCDRYYMNIHKLLRDNYQK